MPQESGNGHQRQRALMQAKVRAKVFDQQHRHQALERIEQQRQSCGSLAARTQHIGSAGVAAAIGTRVVQPHERADNDCKRQRANQISRNSGNYRKYGIQGFNPCLPDGRRLLYLVMLAAHGCQGALLCQRALYRLGAEQLHTNPRIQLNQKAPPPAIDGNAWQIQNALLDVHRHLLTRTKG